jgi:pyridinium-3,5-biscarboxylic acid mononucleotide sulfurtransferase
VTAELRAILFDMRSVVVAFSGGVDSAYLAWAATEVLGDHALCITADSPSYPEHHRQLAMRVAREFNLHHEIIFTGEIDRNEYRANPENRCYFCKHELYTKLTHLAQERGFAHIADGTNADDRGDYRPGRVAAKQFGVRSPLDEAGMTKAEIRERARLAGLPVWDEPASACLSSRIPYHHEVTPEKLRQIERGEDALHALGFRVCRVRHHDTLARVELAREDLQRALEPDMHGAIVRELQAAGYETVSIDPQGYRTGSLNEGLILRQI